ncbi:MAG: hypothetical protein JO130_08645 [Solirubrobacterales bacterium]|nr:hypothetical protein [Solirubrobacterales bacterium]
MGSSESERGSDVAQPREVTRVSPALRGATAVGSPQAAAENPGGSTSAASSAPVTSPPAAPRPLESVAPFHPPSQPRQRGLASRSWVPVALSFGTVIIVAIALVIYFSQHT